MTTNNQKRLIEVAFPLKQVSLGLSAREECAAWAYLHAAHLAGAAAPGGCAGCADCHSAAGPGRRGGAQGHPGAHGGAGYREGGTKARQWPDGREGEGRNRRAASCIGGGRTARTWSGSARKSSKPTGAALPRCWTPSPAAAPSPWRLCAWVAK